MKQTLLNNQAIHNNVRSIFPLRTSISFQTNPHSDKKKEENKDNPINREMQLHISPSLRHVTVVTGKGLREFIKVKVGSRRFSYQMMFYSLLFFTFLLRFVFVLSTVDTIDGDPSPCSSLGKLFLSLPLFIFF